MIYEEVLGKHILHMLSLWGRVGAVICPLQGSSSVEKDHQRSCFPDRPFRTLELDNTWTVRPPIPGSRRPFKVHSTDFFGDYTLSKSVTPILRTCRQIYSESIDVLYTTNTFDFADMNTFQWFTWTIPPEKLARITSLQIGTHPLEYAHIGPPMAIIITRMPALRHLSVRFYDKNLPSDSWITLLSPIRGLQTFILNVIRPPHFPGDECVQWPLSPVATQIRENALLPKENASEETIQKFIKDVKNLVATTA